MAVERIARIYCLREISCPSGALISITIFCIVRRYDTRPATETNARAAVISPADVIATVPRVSGASARGRHAAGRARGHRVGKKPQKGHCCPVNRAREQHRQHHVVGMMKCLPAGIANPGKTDSAEDEQHPVHLCRAIVLRYSTQYQGAVRPSEASGLFEIPHRFMLGPQYNN